jgi:hypothetical protein
VFFYSSDGGEPEHVHVQRQDALAKVWLTPVRIEWSEGFRRADIARVEELVRENRELLMEAWHEYFAS